MPTWPASSPRKGHGVTLVARREERLRTLADELEAGSRIRAEVMACDLTDVAARDALAPDHRRSEA